MRILLVGKFPPLQGGVSVSAFCFVESAVANGHDIYVVTDHEPTDQGSTTAVGSQHVWPQQVTIDRMPRSDMPADPLERIEGLRQRVASVAQDWRAEVIVGWYLVPYAAAAAAVGFTQSIPAIVVHAGSDVNAMIHDERTRAECLAMIGRAARVVTFRRTAETVRKLFASHIDSRRIRSASGFPLGSFYNSTPNAFDLDVHLRNTKERVEVLGDSAEAREMIRQLVAKPFASGPPLLLMYGKASRYKAIESVIDALAALAGRTSFNFVWITGGEREIIAEALSRLVRQPGLAARTWLAPFVQPWSVPALLRAAAAVFCLEDGFPIAWHDSRVTHEVFHAGACAIVSREALEKLAIAGSLVHGVNCCIVERPGNVAELTSTLRELLSDERNPRGIGVRGRLLYRSMYPNHWRHHPLLPHLTG